MKFPGFLAAAAVCLSTAGCGGASGSGTVSVRVVNLVRSATSLTVLSETALLAQSISYGVVTGFSTTSTFPQTVTLSDPSNGYQVGIVNFQGTAGTFYTCYATGVEGSTPAPAVSIVAETIPGTTSGNANVRFGNFSTIYNEAVDVYVTLSSGTTSSTPQYQGIGYGTMAPYASLAAGTYNILVVPTGATSPVLLNTSVSFTAAKNYSLYEADSTVSSTAILTTSLDTY
jgi:hypothetical protein